MPANDPERDLFLSDEDLDLKNCSWAELLQWWDLFLRQAQASNDLDADEYSHGVLALPRAQWPRPADTAPPPAAERDG